MKQHTWYESCMSAHPNCPLEQLSIEWVSPIYVFFEPMLSIVTVDRWRVHEFRCTAGYCKGHGKNAQIVRRYLDTTDRNSTGNLQKHAQLCWDNEVMQDVDACADVDSVQVRLDKADKHRDGSITAAFERKGKGKLIYSHRQHMKVEARFVSDNH